MLAIQSNWQAISALSQGVGSIYGTLHQGALKVMARVTQLACNFFYIVLIHDRYN